MSAQTNAMHPGGEGRPGNGDATTQTKDGQHAAYYEMLADRLENLLRDMQARGTPSDDELLLRLADLLSETRRCLRKALR